MQRPKKKDQFVQCRQELGCARLGVAAARGLDHTAPDSKSEAALGIAEQAEGLKHLLKVWGCASVFPTSTLPASHAA